MSPNQFHGLSTAQYTKNLQVYGLNQLPQSKPVSKLALFLSQFTNPLVYILLAAAVLTLLIQIISHPNQPIDFTEFVGIMIIVVINGLLGYFQESQAEATLQSLTQTIKQESLVIRNGKQLKVPTTQITVGDVVKFKLGDKIPADGVIIQATDVSANESVLTGESEPVAKVLSLKNSEPTEENMLFMGTSVMSGVGLIKITDIGVNSRFGKIAASLASEVPVDTPLQVKLKSFTKNLTILIAIMSVLIVLWGIITRTDLVDILELAISVAVATIPEGLIIALTVILALGMQRILKRRAVVRKLVAAETLGSVSTICIDKTGTLTLGEMQVVQTFFSDANLAKRALLATNHQVNSVEIATLTWLKSNLAVKDELSFKQEDYLNFKIFDSKTKFSATQGAENTYFVGAPEILLEKTSFDQTKKQYWHNEFKAFSNLGMRLVAVAYTKTTAEFSTKQLPDGITWLGLLVLEDPIRPNLAKVFAQAEASGIKVKVITGDFGETARAVMGKIGIELRADQMISGTELQALSERELTQRMPKTKLFYRTTPDQKLMIINNLQAAGEVVAMMGDGINDTPALKKAEIGIVVDNATDFSKEVADIVLLDSDFKTIIAAIEEGRNIFENMRKVITYLLSGAFNALILVVSSLLLGVPVPLLPLQILYINFLADGLPDVALSFEQPEHELMRDRPKPKNYPLIDSQVLTMIVIIGSVVSIATLALYLVLLNQGVSVQYARSLIMLTVGVNSVIYVFSIKSFKKNIWQINLFDNKLMLFGTIVGIGGLLLAIYNPIIQNLLGTMAITPTDWVIVVGITLVNVLLIELIKSKFQTQDELSAKK